MNNLKLKDDNSIIVHQETIGCINTKSDFMISFGKSVLLLNDNNIVCGTTW